MPTSNRCCPFFSDRRGCYAAAAGNAADGSRPRAGRVKASAASCCNPRTRRDARRADARKGKLRILNANIARS
jgi:hypothetical protein